jgi:hypothetical protein
MNNRDLEVSFYANLCCENIAIKQQHYILKLAFLQGKIHNSKIENSSLLYASHIKINFNLYNNQQLDINSNK